MLRMLSVASRDCSLLLDVFFLFINRRYQQAYLTGDTWLPTWVYSLDDIIMLQKGAQNANRDCSLLIFLNQTHINVPNKST